MVVDAAAETRRERRERENSSAPGGLRSPWKYVRMNSRAREVGLQLAAKLDDFMDEYPQVESWLLEGGQAGREKFRLSCEDVLVQRIASLLGATSIGFGRRSRWRYGIVSAYVDAAGDPETQLGLPHQHLDGPEFHRGRSPCKPVR